MTAIEYHNQITKIENSMGRFANRLTGTKSDARDLVQETILKVLTNQDKFTGDTNFKAWALTIMKNIFINNYRRKIRHRAKIDSNNETFFANEARATGGDDPASILLAAEIHHNIEKLKDSLKVPFQMHINGYKYQEIADELNLNIGTIKSRIYLSRQQLREQLNS